MRKLLIIILGLSALWSGYWYVGSSAVEGGITTWLSQQRGGGLNAQYSTLKTRGFPNRFDTTIRDLTLTSPKGDIIWSLPFFQIFALSYQPNHIIAALPKEQTLRLASESISITSEQMKASVVFETGTSLALDRTSVVIDDIKLNSTRGWATSIQSANFATRQTDIRENAHDIAMSVTDYRPPKGFMAQFDPNATLPDFIETVSLMVTLGFDGKWDRFALEGPQPQLMDLQLDDLQLSWGNIDLSAKGSLLVDLNGHLNGQIDVDAKGWRRLVQVAVDAGLLRPNISGTVENLLQQMAEISGDSDTLSAPLKFENGSMGFGPIPLGPAPRLIRR